MVDNQDAEWLAGRSRDQEQYGLLIGEIGRRALESQRLSRTDELTGLSNKSMFFGLTEWALKRAERNAVEHPDQGVAMLFFDADNFKAINDMVGHAEGDRVLVGVARVIADNFRGSDILSRVYGDEFCLVLENVDLVSLLARVVGKKDAKRRLDDMGLEFDEQVEGENGHGLREEMEEEINQMRVLRENGLSIGLSLGIGFVGNSEVKDTDQDDAVAALVRELYTQADMRMYEDKRRRKVGR